MDVAIVDATPADAAPIAALHTASWQATYRGIMPDDFLDRHAASNRLQQWTARLHAPDAGRIILKAVASERLCGFACTFLDASADWGALLDNLHVAPGMTGNGIGERLLAQTRRRVAQRRPQSALHLWVFAANTGARRFYERHGARVTGSETHEVLPGIAAPALRLVWSPLPLTRAEAS